MEQSAGEPAYITVQFEDGPASGLLAELCEDDHCDPKFWRFDEVHKKHPCAKVLYDDGDASFIGEWPRALEGLFVDQDGDEHHYIREAQPPSDPLLASEATEQRPPSASCGESLSTAGCVDDVVDDVEDDLLESPKVANSKRRRRKADEEDWTPGGDNWSPGGGKRKAQPQSGSTSSKRPRRTALDGELKASADGDFLGDSSTQHIDLFEEDIRSSAPQLDTAIASETTSGLGEAASSPDAAASLNMGGAPASTLQGPSLDPAKAVSGLQATSIAVTSKAHVTIDHAKTSRATCRSCGQTIQCDALRCGIEGYAGGHISMQWAHAGCFRERISAEYVLARRGKCKGSGEPFIVGDVRVGFEVGGSKTWFCVREAACYAQRLGVEMGTRIATVVGLEALDLEHREALIAQLNGAADVGPLRRASVAASPSRTEHVKQQGTAAPSALQTETTIGTASTASAPPTQPAVVMSCAASIQEAAAEDSDSDVEVEYGAVEVDAVDIMT